MKTMTMQDRQTLARRYAAGENVTRIAVDLGMSAAAVYAEPAASMGTSAASTIRSLA